MEAVHPRHARPRFVLAARAGSHRHDRLMLPGTLALTDQAGNLETIDTRQIEIQQHRIEEIGRAHVCTPVTNAHLVCPLLLEKKNTPTIILSDITFFAPRT